MNQICPTCGQSLPDSPDPVAQILRRFEETCERDNHRIKSGRVSEGVAAILLNIPKRDLANLRKSGKGPESFYYPIVGSQYAYSLLELADYQATKDEDGKRY